MKRILLLPILALISLVSFAQVDYGCTDVAAVNFNPDAIYDDNTCCYNQAVSISCGQNADVNFIDNDLGYNTSTTVYPGTSSVCLEGNCYVLYLVNYDVIPAVFNFTTTYGDTFEVVVEPSTMSSYTWLVGMPLESGCSDPQACNYNPSIICPSYNNCVYDCYGCTDPLATNFNPTATVENGTCCYGTDGCTDPAACNFDPAASCTINNYCDYSCFGCTDPNAPNYNPSATQDDGSCCTEESWATFISNTSGYAVIYNYISNGVAIYFTANEPTSFCIEDGCYYIDINPYPENNNPLSYTITRNNETIFEMTNVLAYTVYEQFSVNSIIGCADVSACNYDPNVTCYDVSLCDYSCYGCMDPNANNFDPEATFDNGNCCYATFSINSEYNGYWYGFTSLGNYIEGTYISDNNQICAPQGCFNIYFYADGLGQFPISVTDENGGVLFDGMTNEYGYVQIPLSLNSISGCTDIAACNYDPNATCSDYFACNYDCYGCTDVNAPNYSPDATIDNGNCCYNNWFTIELSEEAYWTVSSYSDLTYFYSYGNYPYENGFCVGDGCFDISLYGNSLSPITYTIFDAQGNAVATGVTDSYGVATISLSEENIIGCMDTYACNYNPDANCQDWYNCDYSCYGCTNPAAFNYDATATIDDGTCCTDGWITVEMSEPAYFIAYDNTYSNYAQGAFPEATGFCGFDGCFTFYIYTYLGNPVDFTLTNSEGQIIAQGTTDDFGYYYGSVGLNNEIPGCTDETACNYNAEATCNDGTCNYYCGGCTDPGAINYNPNSWYDDGSCFYTMEPPMMQLQTETVEAEEVYYVRMDVMSVGNGAPYIMMNTLNPDMNMIEENGQYYAGPFPCGEDVVIKLNSAQFGMMEYLVSDPLNGACATISVEENEMKNNISLYPNPAAGIFNIRGLESGVWTMRITDMTGRIVMEDKITSSGSDRQINIENLTNGVYQVAFTNGTAVKSASLVVGGR